MKRKFIGLVLVISTIILVLVSANASAASVSDLTYEVSNGEVTITDCSTSASGALTIPSKVNGYLVTSIGYGAFSWCSGLTSVTIPNSVTIIGDRAFGHCGGLTSVEIPGSATSIGLTAFSYCDSLTNVTIGDGVTSIDPSAFFWCSGLTSITVDANNNYYSSDEYGVLFNKNKTELIQYPIGNTRSSYKIPDSVTIIDDDAFWLCSGLTSVEIPESVTSIGVDAFYNCSGLTSVYITDIAAWCNIDFYNSHSNPLYYANKLYLNGELVTELVIPDSVTSIDSYAFRDCSGLTSVTIGNGIEQVPPDCFCSCINLKKVTIGKNVSVIDANAFGNCSYLETVVIPKSVIEIETGAFSGCNSISTVEYAGSDGEWQEVYIGSDNGTLASATVKYGVILPIVISYNTNGGTGSFVNQKAEEGGSITISSVKPKREGYKFLGWATSSGAKSAEYNPGDVLTVGEDNITLYAVWRKIVSMETDIINNIFIITPKGMENGNLIMFVCYNNGIPVYIDVFEYEESAIVPFTCSEEYTEVKVMALDSLENLTPLCEAEEIATGQEISLLQLN